MSRVVGKIDGVNVILRRIAAAGSAILLLFATGCGSDSNDAKKQNSATVNLEATVVTVTNPGEQPQSKLTYDLSDSDQHGTMDVTQGFGQEANTDKVPDVTSTTMTLPYTAKRDTITLGKPTGSNDKLNPDIATAQGFTLKTNNSPSGIKSEATFTAPEKATETARASIERALTQYLSTPVVFPTDPVGIGAQWDVRIKVNDPSPAVKTITYTLKNHEGNTVELEASVQQRPSTTSLSLSEAPDVPSDTKGSLDVKDSSTSTHVGTVTVDLTKPIPVKGSIDTPTITTYAGDTSGQSDDKSPAPEKNSTKGGTSIIQKNQRAMTWK